MTNGIPKEDDTDHIEFHGRAHHLRQEKEPRARLVGTRPKPVAQECIYAGKVQTVVHGQQHECNGQVAQDKAHANLKIGHLRGEHHAGNTDERDTRDGSAHHAESHHIPRRALSCAEKHVVSTATMRCETTYGKEDGKICYDQNEDNHGAKVTNSAKKRNICHDYFIFFFAVSWKLIIFAAH